jgi:hypothetical protein
MAYGRGKARSRSFWGMLDPGVIKVRCIGGAKPTDFETVDATADHAGQSVGVTHARRS